MMSSFGLVPCLQTGLSKAFLGDYKAELCMRHLSLKGVEEFSVDTGLYLDRASLCKTELQRILESVCIWNLRCFAWVSILRINLLTSSSHELVLYCLSLSWKPLWRILRFLIYKSNKLVTSRLISAGSFCFHVAFIVEMVDIINSPLYCSIMVERNASSRNQISLGFSEVWKSDGALSENGLQD